MAGFLDNIDTSEVKYTENYKPVSKSTTMRVDTDIKKRLNQMALDKDTSIKAQLGIPDMKIPINYALNYPSHVNLELDSLDLTEISNLTFEKPDLLKFKCIQLAHDSIESGGTSPSVLNIANDISVGLFLDKKVSFLDIPKLIELCLEKHNYISKPNLDDIINQIEWTQNFINSNLKNIS